MVTGLQDIKVVSLKHSKIETLIHHVNVDSLCAKHKEQDPKKAVGVDGVTKAEYEANLNENLENLIKRMKSFSYRPQPVRRTYIPKANGKTRPLGIPSYEDKLVQGVMADILNDVYEPRFLDCSYGFRPGRRAHDAIREVNQTIMYKGVNYILDCDIKSFFDNINHKHLMKFLEHDIADKNFLRYIVRFLKSGIMENGNLNESKLGAVQGGSISPVLANVYLHYVLDTWFERCVKPSLKGKAYLVRFADDFVLMFKYENEAKAVYERLIKRLATFGLEVEKDKTRILPFGRFKGTKETFDFLGFTHFNSKTHTGKYTVGHKVSKKKKKLFKQKLTVWVKENRNLDFPVFMNKLNRKLISTYNYYAINGVFNDLMKMHYYASLIVFKWINRRSQRKSFNWFKFCQIWNELITPPSIKVNIWNWVPNMA